MSKSIILIETPEQLLQLLVEQGGESYFGEPVSVLEHSLQAAHFARQAGSADALIAAGLLHDVGHLLHGAGEDAAEQGTDTRHEELAGLLLAAHLPPPVTEPIRLHVAAKRYLCFAESEYLGALSPSSLLSLNLQGGPMTEVEAQEFLALPFARDAVMLRRWDDEAKIPELAVESVESYLPVLTELWR
jgi:phosphonate degradation associated HDIG domain protein